MSYNIKGHGSLFRDRHLREVAAVIRDAGADVVGLQELHRKTFVARYRDQLDELAAGTGLEAVFGRSLMRGKGEYGNAILTRGVITSSDVIPLPGSGEPRTVLHAVVRNDDAELDVFVTHLAAWGGFGRKVRALQTAKVAAIVQGATRPFILMGDFNSTPQSAELAMFHDGKLVMSCFPASTITHRATRQCLDYVFVDPRWTIVSSRVLDGGPSDHWPLVVELRFDSAQCSVPSAQ